MTLRYWVQLVLTMFAALALLTACAGDVDSTRPESGAGMADNVAPVPQNAPGEMAEQDGALKRDVVKTASMRITVADPSVAADEAAVLVEKADGRVDSRTEDSGSGTGRAQTSIVLRVPTAELDGVVRELKNLGTVEYAETTAEDVTAQRVDLDARIRALQTSVDRLLAIMADARDPEALITAENALSQRQAELDSLRAQRQALGDRIEYSTVTVSFTAEQIGGPEPAQYHGFFGQIERGWDALVSVLGSAVLLFGLLLPWLALVAVLAAVCYGLVRWLGGRQKTPPVPVAAAETSPEEEQAEAENRD
ncbi:hypothetical protein BVC93_03365 [Mycobacterium sp. MS1601]|nr:hypothetical protein BVC93_03365 [Mycobacterium sp. MS1601]